MGVPQEQAEAHEAAARRRRRTGGHGHRRQPPASSRPSARRSSTRSADRSTTTSPPAGRHRSRVSSSPAAAPARRSGRAAAGDDTGRRSRSAPRCTTCRSVAPACPRSRSHSSSRWPPCRSAWPSESHHEHPDHNPAWQRCRGSTCCHRRSSRQRRSGTCRPASVAAVVASLVVVGGARSSPPARQVGNAQDDLDANKAQGHPAAGEGRRVRRGPAGLRRRSRRPRRSSSQAMGQEVRWSYFLNDLSLKIPRHVWLDSMTVSSSGGQPQPRRSPVSTQRPASAPSRSRVTAYSHNDVAAWLNSLAKQKGYTQPYFSDSTVAAARQQRPRSEVHLAGDRHRRRPLRSATPKRRATDMSMTRRWSLLTAVLIVGDPRGELVPARVAQAERRSRPPRRGGQAAGGQRRTRAVAERAQGAVARPARSRRPSWRSSASRSRTTRRCPP